MPIETVEVAGLEELLAQVLAVIRELPEGAYLWYRGHSRQSHELMPGIMRHGKNISEVFDREKRLITRFRQRSMPYWPAGYPQSDWEQLFEMQHFGVPTRLLDWSENLFIAAHFALSNPRATEMDPADPPVVWCVDPVEWNRATPVLSEYGERIHVLTTSDEELEAYDPEAKRKRNKSPVAIFGTHNSGRIVAQRGTFFVWGEEAKPLEEFCGNSAATLRRYILKNDRNVLARELDALGFGETMIVPELAALATELTRVEGWRITK